MEHDTKGGWNVPVLARIHLSERTLKQAAAPLVIDETWRRSIRQRNLSLTVTDLHVALDDVERRYSEVSEAGAEEAAEGAGSVEQRRVHLYSLLPFPLRLPDRRSSCLLPASDAGGGLPPPPELLGAGDQRGQDAVEGQRGRGAPDLVAARHLGGTGGAGRPTGERGLGPRAW